MDTIIKINKTGGQQPFDNFAEMAQNPNYMNQQAVPQQPAPQQPFDNFAEMAQNPNYMNQQQVAQQPFYNQPPQYPQPPMPPMVQNYQEGPMISQPRKRNTLATVGFVLSFLTGPIGGAISIAALIQVTKTGEKGKGLAIAGIVIGFAGIIFLVVISVLFSTLIWPSVKNNITKSSYCSQAFSCVDNGDGTSTCKYCLDDYCMEVEEIICED